MSQRRVLIPLIVMLLIAAGCGSGDDGSATTPQSPNQATGSGGGGGDGNGSGDASPPAAGNDQPVGAGEDFPVAIPEGWEVDLLGALEAEGASGFSGGVQLLYPADQFDELVTFYDRWTEEQPDEYAKSEVADTDVVYLRLEAPTYTISLTRNFEDQGNQYTFLLVAVPEG